MQTDAGANSLGQDAKLSKAEAKGANVRMKVPRPILLKRPWHEEPLLGIRSTHRGRFDHPLTLAVIPTSVRRTLDRLLCFCPSANIATLWGGTLKGKEPPQSSECLEANSNLEFRSLGNPFQGGSGHSQVPRGRLGVSPGPWAFSSRSGGPGESRGGNCRWGRRPSLEYSL